MNAYTLQLESLNAALRAFKAELQDVNAQFWQAGLQPIWGTTINFQLDDFTDRLQSLREVQQRAKGVCVA